VNPAGKVPDEQAKNVGDTFALCAGPGEFKAENGVREAKIWQRYGKDMAKRVAHLLVDALVEAGVQRVYGVRGNSLNGITDSIRIKKEY
jgi:hypothetical protein